MFDDKPELYFEYVPGGSLEDYLEDTTDFHNQSIAVQVLSGIEYLHSLAVPTTHRDIKPENVLVQHWSGDSVSIKLADFGLSKQSEHLKTHCGTALYAAPEIHSGSYSPLADIWSIGVLLVRLECGGLPRYRDKMSSLAWSIALISFVQEYLQFRASRLISFVLQDMFVLEAERRMPASKCHAKALQILEEESNGNFGGSASSSVSSSAASEKQDKESVVPMVICVADANTLVAERKRKPGYGDGETSTKRSKVW